ncbi:HTH_Tnp_Tc3_2 domain-containing protein [Trichonephila clavipes]|nr:HTH_Tnp_Tc3_2 domain-containing protein [Trichonephila clavipes]
MEAEYVSLTEATKEFIWLKNVIDNKSLNLELSENVMFCDNQAAISFSKSPVENYRTKHIDVRYHFLRNLIYDKTYRPPPRSERYGSCSVLATVDQGRVYRRGGSGRPRNTNDREDRAIRRVATSAPTTSLASIQRHLPPSRHPVPSRETIRRRLTEVGLRSRRPLRRLPLTPHHRQCRLDFCRPRATWSVTDWRRVIFSDESFSLSADDHRTLWGAISWDTRSSLVVLQGTTARRYVDDILTPIVLPMLSSRPGAIYQQDNAHPHTARLSQQCLQGYDVLPWPVRSPDLLPIEHVWDALGKLQPS